METDIIATVDSDASAGATSPSDGKWLLITETSRYIIDFDVMTATRMPGAGSGPVVLDPPPSVASLRCDEQPVDLVELSPITLGASALMQLDLRHDGVPTFRRTTLVHSFTRLES